MHVVTVATSVRVKHAIYILNCTYLTNNKSSKNTKYVEDKI